MTRLQQDEPDVYTQFIQTVRDFNEAKATYLEEMDSVARQSKVALTQAARTYLKPLVSKLETVQAVSVLAMFVSVLFICMSVSSTSGTSGSDSTGSAVPCVTIGLLATIFIGLVALLWSNQRAKALKDRIKRIESGAWPGSQDNRSQGS